MPLKKVLELQHNVCSGQEVDVSGQRGGVDAASPPEGETAVVGETDLRWAHELPGDQQRAAPNAPVINWVLGPLGRKVSPERRV